MTDVNRKMLLAMAADLRKIIRQGRSHEWQLRSMAQTITDVVREEGKDVLTTKQTEG
jgi:hypothetical protein